MNEQIKELAKQAGFNEYINENLWPEEQPEFNNLMEKFAELLIQECIDCAVTVGYADNRPIEPVYSIHEIKRQIKQHFGVE
jgi:hypothetical protein